MNEKEIYLQFEDEYLPIQKYNNSFILRIDEITSFCDSINQPLHFVNEYNEVIKVDSSISNVEFEKDTFLRNDGRNYYIYR